MLFQSIIQVFILASAFLSVLALPKLNYTRQLRFNTYNPKAVQIDSQIFLVSKYDSVIRIDSSDVNYQSCKIATNLEEEGIDAEKYRAVALGSNKIIVWGFHNSVFNPDKPKGYRKYVILLVDVRNCSYKSLENLEEAVPLNYYLLLPEIVVHRDRTFDVFFIVKSGCLPCRFDEEGRRIEINHQVQSRPLSFRIRMIGLNDSYVVLEGTSLLKLLDREFNEFKRMNLTEVFFIEEFQISSNPTNPQIGLTTRMNFDESTLSSFDSSLGLIFTKILYKYDHDNYYYGSNYLVIDSRGKSFITFQSENKAEKTVKYSILIIDANGLLLSEFDLDVFQSECDHCWIYQPAFLLDDRDYCTVKHFIPIGGYGFSEIKCLDVSEM